MPYPEGGYEVSYGPKVPVEQNGLTDFACAVKQTYRGSLKHPVMWRGMLTIFYKDRPFMDIESTLLDGKDGDPYISWPQREYKDQNDQRKWKNMVWVDVKSINAAAAMAVRSELGDSSMDAPADDWPAG